MASFNLHHIEFGEIPSQERWTRILSRRPAMPGGARYGRVRRWPFAGRFACCVDDLIGDQPR